MQFNKKQMSKKLCKTTYLDVSNIKRLEEPYFAIVSLHKLSFK